MALFWAGIEAYDEEIDNTDDNNNSIDHEIQKSKSFLYCFANRVGLTSTF